MKTLADLDNALSEPGDDLVADLSRLRGDIVVLGAAGKLGPSLIELACRGIAAAGTGAKVHAVSRFSRGELAERLERAGADVIRADITDDQALATLPDAENVIFLVGSKFGTQDNESATWATNTYLPGRVAERYSAAKIVALSTGNVYPLSPVTSGGSTEDDPVGPVGDYAMSCLGRERILTHFAKTNQTPLALIRLNYAVELQYGVLVDLATKIKNGEPVDVTTGFANVVWQGYCNEVILRSLHHADPSPFILNLTGPETLSIRRTAAKLAARMGLEVTYTGSEADTALLSDASKCHRLFGYPNVPLDQVIEWTADWVAAGGAMLGKPTHFETRDGKF
ncbi:NAD-dependent epimerase/dehydratase family protein [Microlunatus parietis]|uniref:Nucleoside-diphosphate-sugar epimerase n=1 Tax=Microlunatus parietis TaxID=682979 RepID=A0A7Y9I4U6_9ACTN|nr:NAD(P)-dependent oxidoreductase [Microlunatus parietis]NYE69829.1 nucleoside-diphosphate-sugar epimerase [Microlunatus parietis]